MAKKKLVKYMPENYDAFFSQYHKLTENHFYSFIIEKMEETPEERRNYEFYFHLAEAYGNLAVWGDGGFSGLEYKDNDENRGFLKKSLDILLSMEEEAKEDFRWYRQMGFIYFYSKEEEKAIAYVEEWAKLDPADKRPSHIIKLCKEKMQERSCEGSKKERKLKVKELPKNYKPKSKGQFSDMDWGTFWSDQGKATLTDEMVRAAEEKLGYKFPQSYIDFMKKHNGGIPILNCYPTKQKNSWAKDHVMIDCFFPIGIDEESIDGTLGDGHWKSEWGYPDIGVAICDTPTSGHQLIFLDYLKCGKEGEPRVSLVDERNHFVITVLANDFEEFVTSLCDESEFEG